jgi:catechol 2,3-dioxygenase-like lactoylglutathione lyase family enzyme
MVTGWFADLCVRDVAVSRRFYEQLLDLECLIDQPWYVELGTGGRVVLALVEAGHPTVPPPAGSPPAGLLLSFEVSDAAEVAARCEALDAEVVSPLRVELGQRHFMVRSPDGTIVDVIQRVPITGEDRRRLAALRRRARGVGA